MNALKRSIGRRGPNTPGVTYLEWYCEPTTSGLKSGPEFETLDVVAVPMVRIGGMKVKVGLELSATITVYAGYKLGERGRADMFQLFDDICTDFELARESSR